MNALPAAPLLKSRRITCSPFRAEDITPEYLAWLNDPEVNRYSRRRNVRSERADALKFLSSLGSHEMVLKIVLNDGLRHVGNIQVGPIDWTDSHGEIRIMVGDRAVWGRGIGTEAIYLVSRFMLNELQLHRVEAISCNPAFMQCVKKLGWREEGILRERFRYDQEYLDYHWFGLLAGDFVEQPNYA